MNRYSRRWLLTYAAALFTLVLSLGTVVQGPNLNPTAAAATGPTLAITGATVTEGNFGSKYLRFNIKVTGTHGSVSVRYTTADGTATAGTDYAALSGTATFSSWQSSKAVSVAVRGDRTYEPNETFTLTLTNPVNATITTATATGTITNDDVAPPATTTTTTTTAPTTTTTTAPTTTTTTTSPPPVTYSLSVTLSGNGVGRVASDAAHPGIDCPTACLKSYPSGAIVTLTATPNEGSTFLGWGAACTGTGACAVTMDAIRGVVANFGSSTEATVTVTTFQTGTGRVLSTPAGIDCRSSSTYDAIGCTEKFDGGTAFSLTAIPDEGSSFGWYTNVGGYFSHDPCDSWSTCNIVIEAGQTYDIFVAFCRNDENGCFLP